MKKFLSVFLLASLLLTACELSESTYKQESNKADEAQQQIINNTPIPPITTSLERENVVKRAELFNEQNKISYIYLINYGRVMAFYTVKGKVSSLRSYLVPTEKLVDGRGNECDWTSTPCYTVSSPDIDGTYGENVEGVFFYTTEGAYVEWNSDYLMSDFPLQLSTQPELVRVIE